MFFTFTGFMDNYIIASAISCVGAKNLQNSKGCMRKCALSLSLLSYIRYDMIWYMVWYDMICYDMTDML
jgi:hypothetical protein